MDRFKQSTEVILDLSDVQAEKLSLEHIDFPVIAVILGYSIDIKGYRVNIKGKESTIPDEMNALKEVV